MPSIEAQDPAVEREYKSASEPASAEARNLPIDLGVKAPAMDPDDVRVELAAIDLVTFQEGPRKGTEALLFQLRITHRDQAWLWGTFDDHKTAIADELNREVQRVCGSKFRVEDIRYSMGSLILTILIVVNSWAIAHQGLLAIAGLLLGSYVPLRTLFNDARNWIPRIAVFVRDLFRRWRGPSIGPAY